MDIKFTPKACKEIKGESGDVLKAALYSGHVVIDMPSFDARCELGETLASLVRGIPEDIVGLRRARESVKLAAKRVKYVEMKRVRDGKEYNSFDDILADAGCTEIITEVTAAVLMGTDEGNG